ncbi:hypothetical protein HYR54_07635 [Candidatus Acetothermia bacterium]|nr:hypothetical protein [Candidatus Acetothermia bacterium]
MPLLLLIGVAIVFLFAQSHSPKSEQLQGATIAPATPASAPTPPPTDAEALAAVAQWLAGKLSQKDMNAIIERWEKANA